MTSKITPTEPEIKSFTVPHIVSVDVLKSVHISSKSKPIIFSSDVTISPMTSEILRPMSSNASLTELDALTKSEKPFAIIATDFPTKLNAPINKLPADDNKLIASSLSEIPFMRSANIVIICPAASLKPCNPGPILSSNADANS